MNAHCPVSGKLTDNTVSRLVALFVFFAATAAMATGAWWVFAVLAVDFVWRSFVENRKSPLAFVADRIVSALGLKRSPSDAAPKLFATRIGLAFAVATFALGASGLGAVAVVAASIFAASAALYAFADVCLGCHMYQLWMRLRGDHTPTTA